MLDVHPPHHPAHTWKDFFIHIATIVVGLVIAVGLEQIVEFVHHRHQLAEVRAALDQERDNGQRSIEHNRRVNAEMEAFLSEDARLLQRHAAGDETPLAGKLEYDWKIWGLNDAAWQTATESAVLGLMPDRERGRDAFYYHSVSAYMSAALALGRDLDRAAAIVRDNPEGKFSGEDTRELIESTHEAQGLLAQSERMLLSADQSSR